jgi:hypothetical protein
MDKRSNIINEALRKQVLSFYWTKYITSLSNIFAIKNNWKNVLYIHTPFCQQKCKYCVYPSFVPNSTEAQYFYNRFIIEEIMKYKQLFSNIDFDQVYFGGGTPTYTNSSNLEKMYNSIPNFMKIPIKMSEVHPYSVTDKHWDLFIKYKFKYISMGIQTFSERILIKQNRIPVSKQKLLNICTKMRNAGIILNADLIFFLDTGEMSDLILGKQDLFYVLAVLKPTSLVIHLNYRVKQTKEKNIAVMKMIRQAIKLFPSYKCVNSLLDLKDALEDSKKNAEYRLMRDNFDFDFYMIHKYPLLPVYGYNILGLGYFKNIKVTTNFNFVTFLTDQNRIKVKTIDKKIYNLYRESINIRRHLQLKYYKYSDNFFKLKSDRLVFQKYILQMKANPLLDFCNK